MRRVRQQFRARGTLQPQTHLWGRKTLLTRARQARLEKLVAEQPDATLAELGRRLDRPFGPSTVDLWLHKLELSCKKRCPAAEQQRPAVAEQSARRSERLAGVSSAWLIFVDKSGANTKMTRWYGRCPVGPRLVGHQPEGHYQTGTLIGGMGLRGPCAPWLFEGAMEGKIFLAWVRQGLVSQLQPGDWVIQDTLVTHKVAGVRAAIEAAGCRLAYLPAYSPDFNPSENLWSKIKQILRRLALRTDSALLKATATAFAAIPTTDCEGFFLNANYAI